MRGAFAMVGVGALVIILGMWMMNKNANLDVQSENNMSTLTLTSPMFENNSSLPSRFTCDGESISPPLSWSGVPEGTKSLVLIADDPDAPHGTWDHWVLFNVAPTITTISEGGTAGIPGANGVGKSQYYPPCPPSGTHRYFFHLYALDMELPLKEGATKQEVLAAMEGHILGQAELMGRYKRR